MRSNRPWISSCAAVAALALSLSATPAAAQTSLALDRFVPAPAGDRMFGVESPFVAGHLTPHVMLIADYAHNPLVLRTENGGDTLGHVVANQLFLHLNASFALWNRLNINVDIPAALLQTGDSPSGGGLSFQSPSKAQFGDVRAGLRVRLLGEYDDAFQLGIGGYVWFPTGPKGSFVSDGTVRGMPEVIIGGRTDRVVWTFAVGTEIRKGQDVGNVRDGITLESGAGLGVLLGDSRHVQIGPEVKVTTVLEKTTKRSVSAEALLDLRYRPIDDLELGLGAGPGLTAGVGTPDFRGVVMIAYTPEQKKPPPDRDKDGILDKDDACIDVPGVRSDDPKKNGCPTPKDRDGDGIFDEEDACPDVAGVMNSDPKKHGCPRPLDRDKDGIIDDEDACPDVPGVPSDDKAKNGCPLPPPPPPDRDGDGIPDKDDACPDIKGVKTEDPATNGCPPDTDGDGIRDDKDACPNEKGPADPDPTKNGCPIVRVIEGEILILEQVQFDTGKATIKKVSDGLLDQVAKVMKDHPELTKIEVQGHTDNKGIAFANKLLSQNRANAVKKALVKRGIADKRLTAKGFGQDVPIADNGTDEGRQKNRRVQFKIVEKSKKPAN